MGEVIKLGRHRLLCGDSCNIDDVQKFMDGKLADTVLTDPPYGMRKGIKNDNQGIEFYKRWMPISFEVLKPYGNWLCFGNTFSMFTFYYETLRRNYALYANLRENHTKNTRAWLRINQQKLKNGILTTPPRD